MATDVRYGLARSGRGTTPPVAMAQHIDAGIVWINSYTGPSHDRRVQRSAMSAMAAAAHTSPAVCRRVSRSCRKASASTTGMAG